MLTSFSVNDRSKNIQSFTQQEFDICIIGGGINGAGIARDAAMRGMKVALLEADDFASGTSSRSSKLVHGGIRYLENLEFGLVHEALSERAKLFEIAPHLVHPLRFVLPVYKNSKYGMFMMGMGMLLYDILSAFEAPQMHEKIAANETKEHLPLLQQQDLKGAYIYSDAYMDDDRLVIESLRSASHYGAKIANYCKVRSAHWSNAANSEVEQDLKNSNESPFITQLDCEDLMTQQKFSIKAKHFISCVGPWTDIFGESIKQKWQKKLRPTKGIHLTVARDRVNLKDAIVMMSQDQKRIIFGIPRHEMLIFGTTDTDYPGNPSEVRSEVKDVEYLLKEISNYFPEANLTAKDIISSYAGVRPLVFDGAESEGKTSREHSIWSEAKNCTFVAGGKYTTYRLIAEEAVEKVLSSFPLEQQMKFHRCQTYSVINPMCSVENLKTALLSYKSWDYSYLYNAEELSVFVQRHGMEAQQILSNYATLYPDSLWAVEAAHAIDNTMCTSLSDFMLRRTPLFLAYKDHGKSQIDKILYVFANKLRWSESKKQQEVQKYQQHIDHELAWQQVLV